MKKVIKSISINEAKKNMVLANTIRDSFGNVIFEKGVNLDYTSISTIRKEGVHYIYIYEFVALKDNILKKEKIQIEKPQEIPEKVEFASNINDEEEAKYAVPASPKSKPPLKDVISVEIRKKGEDLVKELFVTPNRVQYSKAMELVSTIVDDILNTDETIISVQDLRSYDNYTYQHSVNLAVLGVTVGKMLNYSQEKLKDFGVGLLFHDFGKTKIPLEILNKPDRLTPEEFEVMKGHSEFGYQILSRKYKLPEIAKMVIRHHHEKMDGSGYPHGLKNEQIPEWVQIATIIDIYDALTADRIYKTQWTHQKAVEFLFDKADKWFNIEYIRVLQSTIPEKRDSFTLLDF